MVCFGRGWGWELGELGELLGASGELLGSFFDVLGWFCCAGAVLCASFQKTRGVFLGAVSVGRCCVSRANLRFNPTWGLFYKEI